jgi:flagellar biosynthetic protein FliQ
MSPPEDSRLPAGAVKEHRSMGIPEAIGLTHEALLLIASLTAPLLLITTAVGMVLILFQSVTQINDPNLQQMIKIALTLAIIFSTAPALFIAVREYTLVIFDRIDALQ